MLYCCSLFLLCASNEAVNAVFVDLWRSVNVRVAARKDNKILLGERRRISLHNKGKKKIALMIKRGRLSYLFSSNLVALCLSRFKIQISRDTPDNDTAPPAAKPEATAATGAAGAGDKTKGWWVLHLHVHESSSLSLNLVLGSASFTLACGFVRSPVTVEVTGHQLVSV